MADFSFGWPIYFIFGAVWLVRVIKTDAVFAHGINFAVIILLLVLKLLFESVAMAIALNKLPKYLAIPITAIAALLFAADLLLFIQYGSIFDEAAINLILDTNIWEIRELIFMNILPIVAGLLVTAIMATASQKFAGKHLRLPVPTAIVVCGFFTYAALFPFHFFGGACAPLLRMVVSLPHSLREIAEYRETYDNLSAKKIVIDENNSTIPYIVLIVGESTSRNHMGIYGWHNPNTPFAEKHIADGSMLMFDDVVSPHSETSLVFQKLLSFCNNESADKWYKYGNLIDIMKKAGYRTTWVSNQETSGIYGNVARAYANRCDRKFFTAIKNSSTGVPVDEYVIEHDEKILPLLDGALADVAEKNFIVLHTMGTHFLYEARYPQEFAKFTAADENNDDPKENQILAYYDNAVLYNDYITEEIMRRFVDKCAVVVYLSDHGEEVFEDRHFSGHFHDGTFWQIEIPMFVWGSEKFRQTYPDLWARISAARHRPYMTDDLIHSILDMADIKTPEYEPQRSIFSPEFVAERRRIYNNMVYTKDYRKRVKE